MRLSDADRFLKATLRHIACEGRCFVLGCNQHFTKEAYPSHLQDRLLSECVDPLCRGGSVIIGPLGEYIAGPLYDKEDILYADLSMEAVVEAHFDFDVIGHYSRPDVRLD